MDISKLKTASPNRSFLKKIVAVLFSITVIVTSYIVINNASKEAQDVIEVIRVKSNEGIPAFVTITDQHIEKYKLIKREYTDDMVLAEDIDQVLNKLTSYYIRQSSILYHDQLIDEKPVRNEWLYNVEEENEVLTLPYNYLEAGGNILMPGDRVRIRVSYETDEVDRNQNVNSENPNAIYTYNTRRVMKTEVLFDSIIVKDMLNSNSHSIYEVYKEVQKLNETKRQEVMKSREFINNIQPRALLLEGSKEQVDNFSKFKGYDGQSFLITILSRSNSDVVLDQLPTLENEVESWIGSHK